MDRKIENPFITRVSSWRKYQKRDKGEIKIETSIGRFKIRRADKRFLTGRSGTFVVADMSRGAYTFFARGAATFLVVVDFSFFVPAA